MPRDDATLLDILRAARLAVAFMGDLNKPAFLNDLKTQSAILHQLLVLGEEDKNFKRTFSETVAELPGLSSPCTMQ
jgi:uncharacterized protein with HEPN domain